MDTSSAPTLVRTIAARSETGASSLGIRTLSVAFVVVLTAAAAQVSVPLPFTSVPLTFQPMVVLLGGLALGARLGATAQLIYLAAGIVGLPVFAASVTLPPGLLRLAGPTGGYLMAYPVAAFITGLLAERRCGRRYLSSFAAMVAGLAVIYLGGVLWLGLFIPSGGSGLAMALAAGVYPFVLFDLFKLAAAAGVVPGLWRLFGTDARS